MKPSIKAALVVAAAAACFAVGLVLRGAAPAEAQSVKVAVIDMEFAMDNFPEALAASEKIDRLKIQREEDLKTRVMNQFGTTEIATLNDMQRLEAERVLDEAEKNFQAEADALRAAEWEPAVEKIFNSVKKTADSMGFDVVIEKGSVVYGGSDITDVVLKDLNPK